jgi:hypothetical protein
MIVRLTGTLEHLYWDCQDSGHHLHPERRQSRLGEIEVSAQWSLDNQISLRDAMIQALAHSAAKSATGSNCYDAGYSVIDKRSNEQLTGNETIFPGRALTARPSRPRTRQCHALQHGQLRGGKLILAVLAYGSGARCEGLYCSQIPLQVPKSRFRVLFLWKFWQML